MGVFVLLVPKLNKKGCRQPAAQIGNSNSTGKKRKLSFPATEFCKCEGTGKKNRKQIDTTQVTTLALQSKIMQHNYQGAYGLEFHRNSMSWFFGLGISMSWFFGLGISMSWYMCLHGLVFVIIVKTKKPRIIMSIMLLKNISTFFKRHVSIKL